MRKQRINLQYFESFGSSLHVHSLWVTLYLLSFSLSGGCDKWLWGCPSILGGWIPKISTWPRQGILLTSCLTSNIHNKRDQDRIVCNIVDLKGFILISNMGTLTCLIPQPKNWPSGVLRKISKKNIIKP